MVRAQLTSFSILTSPSLSRVLVKTSTSRWSFALRSRPFSSQQNVLDLSKNTDSFSNEAPKNLFEVFAKNQSLSAAKAQETNIYTTEAIEQEVKRQGRRQRSKSIKIDPSKVGWTSGSKRVGAIGVKLGMSALWLKDGRRVPVTLVQV